jgi:hypothetical protein
LPELRGIRCGDEHPAVAYALAVDSSLTVRPARVQDVRQMARVYVRCWQETYRGLMPDAVLDDPGFPAARERMWTGALTGERYRQNRVAVAERDGELVGIASRGNRTSRIDHLAVKGARPDQAGNEAARFGRG